MAGHSRFAPSATEREYTCPGSFLLNEAEPDRQSHDAAHGTAAHHVGDLCLRYNHDVSVYAGCVIAVTTRGRCRFVHSNAPLNDDPEFTNEEHLEAGFEVDDEMVSAVQEYVDRCRALPGEHHVEVRVEHTDWCPDKDEWGEPLGPQYGTSDHVACIAEGSVEYVEATLVVSDLKFGKGVMVFARENKQAMKYALGCWKEFNWIYNFKRIIIRILQPRLDHFDEWEISVEELLEWGQRMKKRLELVFAPDPPFQASEKGCKFCKISGRCRAQQDYLHSIHALHFDDLTAEPVHNPKLLTDDELMQAYYAGPVLALIAKAVDKEIFRRLAAGQPSGRLKLVAAHTHRTWRDEEAARRFLREKEVDDSKSVVKKLVSPAQAEKLLPRALWPELEALYVRPPGGPCVVDQTDPRQPYRNSAILDHFDDGDGFDE